MHEFWEIWGGIIFGTDLWWIIWLSQQMKQKMRKIIKGWVEMEKKQRDKQNNCNRKSRPAQNTVSPGFPHIRLISACWCGKEGGGCQALGNRNGSSVTWGSRLQRILYLRIQESQFPSTESFSCPLAVSLRCSRNRNWEREQGRELELCVRMLAENSCQFPHTHWAESLCGSLNHWVSIPRFLFSFGSKNSNEDIFYICKNIMPWSIATLWCIQYKCSE